MKSVNKIKNSIFVILAVLFWIAIWQIASGRVDNSLILPKPAETFSLFIRLSSTLDFWQICLLSVKRIFSGALFGVLTGIVIALLSYISPFLKYLFSPLLSLVKSTPIASFIIIFLVWIGKEQIPFYISLMMVAPIVSSNLLEGLGNIDQNLKEVIKVYRIGFLKSWRLLYRHSLLPYFLSSLRSGVALAWKAGIAAEVLCTPKGTLGEMLYESKLYLETPSLFAWTIAVILLSFMFEKIILFLTNAFLGGNLK